MMQDFQQGNSRVLISTDTHTLTRGVDVQNLSVVINFDMPNPAEFGDYIHRLNSFNPRSRSGGKGVAINFEMPNAAEFGNYIHRLNSFNNRSRSGWKGVAINFATSDEVPVLHDIEHKCSTKIEALPSNGEFCNPIPNKQC